MRFWRAVTDYHPTPAPWIMLFIMFVNLWVFPGNYWNSHWWSKWFVMQCCMAFSVGIILTKYSWVLAPVVWATLGTSMITFGWKNNYFSNVSLFAQVALGKSALYAAYSFLLLLCFTIWSRRHLKAFGDALAMACIINSILILYQLIIGIGSQHRGAFLGNPSMAGCFIACTYPFLALQPRERLLYPSKIAYAKKLSYVIIPILAVFATDASIPIGIFGLVLGSWCALGIYKQQVEEGHNKYIWPVIAFMTAITGLLLIGYFLQGHELFEGNGRWRMWQLGLSHWKEAGPWQKIFGFGNGTTQLMLMSWQAPHQSPEATSSTWFMWYHNDWLQILLDMGLFGLAAYVTLFVTMLFKAVKKSPWLFSSVLGYGAMAFFNYPARMPVHALLGFLLVALCLERNDW